MLEQIRFYKKKRISRIKKNQGKGKKEKNENKQKENQATIGKLSNKED